MSRTERHHPEWYPVEKQGRDKKPFYKPDKAFKKVRRQQERAKVKDALRHIFTVEEPIMPTLRKNDEWDWN